MNTCMFWYSSLGLALKQMLYARMRFDVLDEKKKIS